MSSSRIRATGQPRFSVALDDGSQLWALVDTGAIETDCKDAALVREVGSPTVPSMEVRELSTLQRSLGIDQQHHNIGFAAHRGIAERVECFVARACTDEPPVPAPVGRRLFLFVQKGIHATAQSRSTVPPISAAFDVDFDAAHGLAPSSPMRQRSPSW